MTKKALLLPLLAGFLYYLYSTNKEKGYTNPEQLFLVCTAGIVTALIVLILLVVLTRINIRAETIEHRHLPSEYDDDRHFEARFNPGYMHSMPEDGGAYARYKESMDGWRPGDD